MTRVRFFSLSRLALVIGLLSFAALIGIDRVGVKQNADFLLGDALLDLQIRAAAAHLGLEEDLSGEEPGSMAKVREDFAAAAGLADALLAGGESKYGLPLHPPADAGLLAGIRKVRERLRDYEAAALERAGHPEAAGRGSPRYRRFHQSYHDFQREAAALEEVVENGRIRAHGAWRRYFILIAAAWLGLVLATAAGIWSHERRRRAAEEALRASNEELRARSGDLAEHRARLAREVEERTAELTKAIHSYQNEIVEREKSEARLRLSESRFRTLVEHLPQAICLKDTGGVYLYCNEIFARDLGLPPGEISGRTDHDLYPPELAARYADEDRRILTSGEIEETEERSTRDDGREVVLQRIKLPVRNEEGEIAGVLAIIRDVTDKLKLEAVAEAANTMENIGYVFAGIRHEIGNPVNAMKLTLSVLAEKLDSATPEAIRVYLERIAGELSRAEYLLKALKSFNMYETPELHTASLNAFLVKFLALVGDDYARRGIRVECELPAEDVAGRFDPRALQQVLLNILGNAADALEKRPEPRIAIAVARSGDGAVVTVRDNGRGMSAEQRRDLFKPFRTTKSGGTGLGLVIARKMMLQMNGSIEVRSGAGEGTTVVLTLPGAAP